MSKSFQDRRKEKQKASFIGRSEHLNIFKSNLASKDPLAIFNIYGQGGVGKSYLMNHYKSIAGENNCLTAYTDENIKSVLQWMGNVSDQFKKEDAELSEFDKHYKTYLQEIKKLETDPEKPKGTLGGIVKAAGKGLVKEGKKWIPGAEIIAGFFDEESLASTLGDWAEFARKKITNKDEVELVLEPEKVLTPLFWKGISKHQDDRKFICFFIDTFEETDTVLEKWILEVLDGKHGDIPGNILLTIAGRDQLNPNFWSAFKEHTQIIPLAPFTEEEANEYLLSQKITNPAMGADIKTLSGRLPVMMAWLTGVAKTGDGEIGDSSSTAVERFLKWVHDDTLRDIALAAALPRKLNQDIIECLLDDKSQAKNCFDWLCSQPFVLKRNDYWIYHAVVRVQMLRFKRTRSHKEWAKLQESLAANYESLQKELELKINEEITNSKWFEYEQEREYHYLCCKPDKFLPSAIRQFIRCCYEEPFSPNAALFGETFQSAGIDNDHIAVEKLGKNIILSIKQLLDGDFAQCLKLFKEILAENWIKEDSHKSFIWLVMGIVSKDNDECIDALKNVITIRQDFPGAYYHLAIAYFKNKNYDAAIESCKKAISMRPAYFEAMHGLGNSYVKKNEYDNALGEYEKVIAIKPDKFETHLLIILIYHSRSDFDKAIEACKRAIAVKPDQSDVLYWLAYAYSKKHEYDKAIEFFQKAILIKPDYYKAFYELGNAYLHKQDYDKAIEAYQNTIAIKSDYDDAFFNMANAYLGKNEYDKAVDALKNVVAIKPERFDALYIIGLIFASKGNYDDAIECYSKVIAAKSDHYEVFCSMGRAYSKKGNKEKAIEFYQISIDLKPDNYKAYLSMGFCLIMTGEIRKAETFIQKAIELGDLQNGNLNMGHVYLCREGEAKAIQYYKESLKHFEDKSAFWKEILDNYQYLEQYGITREYYDNMLHKITEE